MKSALMQKDREEMIALCKRMTPEERLAAHYRCSQLAIQMHLAGVKYRAQHPVPSRKQKRCRPR